MDILHVWLVISKRIYAFLIDHAIILPFLSPTRQINTGKSVITLESSSPHHSGYQHGPLFYICTDVVLFDTLL